MPSTPSMPSRLRVPMRSLVVGAVASVVLLSLTGMTASATPTVVSVKPEADTYVRSDQPDAHFGAKYVLSEQGASPTTPRIVSYLRFTVTGLTGAPGKVTLNVYTYSKSSVGLQVWTADSGWSETGMTYRTAPALSSSPVASIPSFATNTWSSIDVSSVVTANGTYTFAVTTADTGGKQEGSREGGTPPRLDIELASTPTPTGSTTPTPTGSTTPTPTGSTTPTAAPTATSSPSPNPSPTATPVTTTFPISKDSYVRSDQPDINYGAKYNLAVEAGSSTTPTITSYLTIPVTGLTGTVTAATLQLYSYATTTLGITAWATSSDWTEGGITYATAPPLGAELGTQPTLMLNTWASIDLGSAITGNGTFSIAITTTRTANNTFGSHESSAPPKLVVTTVNDAGTPPPTTASPSPTPSPSPTSSGSSDPTIVAAGDISCTQGSVPGATSCQQAATSDVALGLHPVAVLPLGDDQYELGSLSDFQAMYDPTWGQQKAISYPVPGNHEYGYIGSSVQPTGGAGYFTYFGDRAHPLQPGCISQCASWYSYDVGSWHLIALDSQCAVVGGCNPGNPQYTWLQNDLKMHTNQCTMAYWHIPIYASSHDRQPDMQAINTLLYNKGADVVLSGHAHFYERFAPQNASGGADPTQGIRQFVVGTGGRSFFAFSSTPMANSEVRIGNTFGVLGMTLSPDRYSWAFVALGGAVLDSGTTACH